MASYTKLEALCIFLLFLSFALPSMAEQQQKQSFASGVILATGYVHVLPDSFDELKSSCLPENPWRKFPFTTFVAKLSAVYDAYRGLALEMGIVVHSVSVVIGLAMGASSNPCTIRPLIAAICFHLLFEGIGLGLGDAYYK
ncbi:hypothetical protein Patl1_16606 [Pistacia atlantica]|uniref:Uncharacterized protein n=1 Tax=Pistacia atlantica TaxID=434234 RepID=A0ACC1BB23_9ROSI|nr:hypothetical protein Patl1_16606 [Pistacia atlantica]